MVAQLIKQFHRCVTLNHSNKSLFYVQQQRKFFSIHNKNTDNNIEITKKHNSKTTTTTAKTQTKNNNKKVNLHDILYSNKNDTTTTTTATSTGQYTYPQVKQSYLYLDPLNSINNNNNNEQLFNDQMIDDCSMFNKLEASSIRTYTYNQIASKLINKQLDYNFIDVNSNGQQQNQPIGYNLEDSYHYNYKGSNLRHILNSTIGNNSNMQSQSNTNSLSIHELLQQSINNYIQSHKLKKFQPVQKQVTNNNNNNNNQLTNELQLQGISVMSENSTTSHDDDNKLEMDSVRRKRHRKMNRHKLKKRRKRERMMSRKSTT